MAPVETGVDEPLAMPETLKPGRIVTQTRLLLEKGLSAPRQRPSPYTIIIVGSRHAKSPTKRPDIDYKSPQTKHYILKWNLQ